MRRFIRNFSAACLAAGATFGSVVAANSAPSDPQVLSLLNLNDILISHSDSALNVSFDINPAQIRPGRDRQVVFTPVIRSADPAAKDSVVLESMTIAGRNRYYSHLRNGNIEDGEMIYQAGKKANIQYIKTLLWQPWMENSYIYMREETQDCCRPVKPLCDTPLAAISTLELSKLDKDTDARYVALTGDESVELEAQGSAFIDFIVNRTEIRDNYRKNPVELKKIIESIDKVKQDPDATITRLTIKGFASPEGPYDNNVRLAMGRTEALKEYVRKMYAFDPEIMVTNYEPEDWGGLRRWLEQNSIANKDAILAIVDSDLAPDPKDNEIKRRFPREYKMLLDSVYPALRHSDYTVRYKIRTFVDIDELMEVYKEHPERLRPVDFYRISQTFPLGSVEAEEVLLKASEIYPNDEEAAVNAANILMRRGDYEAANRKARMAGDSGEAYFTRGMLALQDEYFDQAEDYFRKAADLGIKEAENFVDRLERNKSRENITYYIETNQE